MRCMIYNLLYRVVPLNQFRSYLLDKHLSLCPGCSSGLAAEAEIEKMIVNPAQVRSIDLWPEVSENILSLERGKNRGARKAPGTLKRLRLGWAVLTVIILVFLIPLLLNRSPHTESGILGVSSKGDQKIVIKSLKIENRPARSFYFQSKDENKLIVWVKKT